MTKYNVYMTAVADLTVTVDIDDDGLGRSEIEEQAIEAAYDEGPDGLCSQCTGWGQSWSVDIGEWEPIDKDAVGKR